MVGKADARRRRPLVAAAQTASLKVGTCAGLDSLARIPTAQSVVALDLPISTPVVSMRRVSEREADEMVGEFSKEGRRHQLFVRQLTAALLSEPEAA